MENATKEETTALCDLMVELMDKETDLKKELKETQQKIDEVKFHMDKLLEEEKKDIITCGYWSFGYKTSERTTFNQSKFKEAHPKLYEEFQTTSEIKKFCFGHIHKGVKSK